MIKLNAQIRVQRLAGKVLLIPSDGAGGPLQAKTAYPSHSEQIIAPDEDYYGLVSVTVKPVPKLPFCAVSVAEGITETVENVVNIAAVVSVNGVTWTHSLYGGVRLPNIPEDVLTQYPFALVYKHSNGSYRLIVCTHLVYWYPTSDYPTCVKSIGNAKAYKLSTDASAWEFLQDNNPLYFITPEIAWSNHDIPNGSETATDIYFHGSEPVPTD